ncbi:MAG TPA: transposase [Planctomycetota bacterium]|nr:transposase [Planctomycetota bacterium]
MSLTLAAFHIVARAARRGLLVLDDEDARTLISLIRTAANRFNLRILSACVMLTHYHLLVRAAREALSEAMQFINYMYTMYFNEKHGGSGHVLEAPYRAFPKDSWPLILACSRYISLNPLVTVPDIEQLPAFHWSTLPALIGKTYLDWLDLEVLNRIDPDPVAAASKYWAYVKAGEGGFRLGAKAAEARRIGWRVRFEWTQDGVQLAAAYAHWMLQEIKVSLPGAPRSIREFTVNELALYAASRVGVGSIRQVSSIMGIPSSSGHLTVRRLEALASKAVDVSGFFDRMVHSALGGNLGQLCQA